MATNKATKRRSSTEILRNVTFMILLVALVLNEWVLGFRVLSHDTFDDASFVSPSSYETKRSSISSNFDKVVSNVFNKIVDQERNFVNGTSHQRKDFILKTWDKKTEGGLYDEDRILLAKIYRQANSVFEFGLGESTYIADHVGVPRYAGVDSSVEWVDLTKQNVSNHFRFYYGDTGVTQKWGVPVNAKLVKSIWQYQIAPLQAELKPFDVYMVDGRWRVACVLLSFLHASARGAKPEETTVLMHDCIKPGTSPNHLTVFYERRKYYVNDDILELVDHSGVKLCVYKRKQNTTDDMLLERYELYKNRIK